ncbi:MAG: hypothetical protein M1826_000275 [Phylliscum demangeonii]|nr:MAG: hypothetical protein M1826_000275 [Phylliscum demangeonii]
MRSLTSFLLACMIATNCTWALTDAPPPPSADGGGPPDAGWPVHAGGSRHNLPTEIAGSIFYLSAGFLAGTGVKQFAHMLRGRPDLEHMFAPSQLSRLGLLWPRWAGTWTATTDPVFVQEIGFDDGLLPAVHAFQNVVVVEKQRILYVMMRDNDFMACVFQEMGKPVPTEEYPVPHSLRAPAPRHLTHMLTLSLQQWPFIDAELFFAAQVCEQTGGRRYDLRFPRVADYLSRFTEPDQWNEAALKERVRERLRSLSFSSHAFRQGLPHRLHRLSKVISRVAPTVRRLETAVQRARWAKAEAGVGGRALVLESHF